MLKVAIRPTSLDGIKRLAKQIKKSEGVTHSVALNKASKAGSFENFRHAIRHFEENEKPCRAEHELFLTYYWYERDPYRTGRETLRITLSRPLPEICSKKALQFARGVGGMRLAASDHLLHDGLAQSQEFARGELCKAARALRFIEATGLQPSDARRAREATAEFDEDLPGADHGSDWYDPRTGQFVLTDEPYTNAKVSTERAEWAARNKWHLQGSSWPGLYNPPFCALFVATCAEGDLDFAALMKRINDMSPPVTSDNWPGTSERGHGVFFSPMAKTPQDHRRARAKGTIYPTATKTTVPYGAMFGASRRKPVGVMGLAEHQEAGRLIKGLLRSKFKPWAVNPRLETLRSTLEDWLNVEISQDILQEKEFFAIYYGPTHQSDHLIPNLDSPQSVINALGRLKNKLSHSYPDCAPLRKLTGRIDTALKFTQRFQMKDAMGDTA
jgi:hypothetical protein